MQVQISWLLQRPTDLDLQCLQRQGISGFSRTRVKFCFFMQRSLKLLSGMAKSVDPDQTAPLEQSDLGLHCLHMPFCQTLGFFRF